MNKDQELAVKFVEALGKQNPTAEEKKLQAFKVKLTNVPTDIKTMLDAVS